MTLGNTGRVQPRYAPGSVWLWPGSRGQQYRPLLLEAQRRKAHVDVRQRGTGTGNAMLVRFLCGRCTRRHGEGGNNDFVVWSGFIHCFVFETIAVNSYILNEPATNSTAVSRLLATYLSLSTLPTELAGRRTLIDHSHHHSPRPTTKRICSSRRASTKRVAAATRLSVPAHFRP